MHFDDISFYDYLAEKLQGPEFKAAWDAEKLKAHTALQLWRQWWDSCRGNPWMNDSEWGELLCVFCFELIENAHAEDCVYPHVERLMQGEVTHSRESDK